MCTRVNNDSGFAYIVLWATAFELMPKSQSQSTRSCELFESTAEGDYHEVGDSILQSPVSIFNKYPRKISHKID